jgi:heterotetrameric sarcosine oxidase gamma subunit
MLAEAVTQGSAEPEVLALPAARLRILQLPPRGLISFQTSHRIASARAALRTALGFEPPSRANTAASGNDAHCLWISPRHWLIECDSHCSQQLFLALCAQESTVDGTARATPCSEGFDTLLIRGMDAARLLAKGCPLDLRCAATPTGTAVRSRFADVPIVLHKEAATVFRVHADVSLSHYLWCWLSDARETLLESERVR